MKVFIPGAGGKVQHLLNFKAVPEVSELVISDIYDWSYGNFVADRSYLLPKFEDPSFLDAVKGVHEIENFDVCIPLHDASLTLFSRNRSVVPFDVALNGEEAIKLVADKIATATFFDSLGLRNSPIVSLSDYPIGEPLRSPQYVKPRHIHLRGTAKQFFMKVDDDCDLNYVREKLAGRESEFVIQEFIDGTEINIDFFCDENGEVRSAVPLKRLAMGSGRGISRGVIIDDPRFRTLVEKVAAKIELFGANQLQVFVTPDDDLVCLELNGRLSGSTVLLKAAGIDFFDNTIRLIQGRSLSFPETTPPLHMTTWERPMFYHDSPAIELDRGRTRDHQDAPSMALSEMALLNELPKERVFHQAIPTHDLDLAEAFYTDVMGATRARRYDDRITLNFMGDQVVCHLTTEPIDENPKMYPRHFGMTFIHKREFDLLHDRIAHSKHGFFQTRTTRWPEKPERHDTFFVLDPSNNVLEFKWYSSRRFVY